MTKSIRALLNTGLPRFCLRHAASPSASVWGTGCWLGMYCYLWSEQFFATFGRSPAWITSAVWGVMFGLLLSVRRGVTKRAVPSSGLTSAWCHLGWAFWTVSLPFLGQCLLDLVGMLSVSQLSQNIVSGAVIMSAGLFCWSFPAYLSGRQFSQQLNQYERTSERADAFLAASIGMGGCSCGLACMALVIAPFGGTSVGLGLLLLGSGVAFISSIASRTAQPENDSSTSRTPEVSKPGLIDLTGIAGWGALLGALFSLMRRDSFHLFPASSYLEALFWSGLLCGIAASLWLVHRYRLRKIHISTAFVAVLLSTLFLALILRCEATRIHLNLWINARIDRFFIVMLLRGFQVAWPALCIGVLAGCGSLLARWRPADADSSIRLMPTLIVGGIGACIGLTLINFWGMRIGAAPQIIGCLLALVCLLFVVRAWHIRGEWRIWRSVMSGGLLALTIALLSGGNGFEFETGSAKMLFSTNVFGAYNRSWDQSLLPHLDEARCIDSREGLHGTQTVWTYLGVQCQLRENGIPRGVISVDPQVSPDYSGEVLSAVVPLVLHERPRRVMVLGMGGGTPLRTVLAFPVQEIFCNESDRSLIEIQEDVIAPRIGSSVLSDDRVKLLELDPLLAVTGRDQPCDVLISNPHASSLSHATYCFTREYYQRIFDRLATDGIFCQRFQQADYGARPLGIICGTLRAVFPEVVALETGPAEILLLASKTPNRIMRDGLVSRLQSPQVREVLAHVGWDWSILLNLNTLMTKKVDELISEKQVPVNSTRSLCFANELPREVIRWGAKLQEVQQLTSGKAGHFLDELSEADRTPELLNRLSDVTARNRLMNDYPDQYWMYRKTVRELVTSRPRSVIRPVSVADEFGHLHPEDRRRIDYFEALGEAASQKSPDPAILKTMATFTRPYDPLLSYFIHQEVAELYAKSSAHGSKEECRHRLHAIHFGFPSDRSVRNVVDALRLIVEHPQCLPDPWLRWDHLNGLLQSLKIHWDNRGQMSPESTKIALNDIDQSLLAIEKTFTYMDDLSEELRIDSDEWHSRKLVVEKGLVRPLRTYRAQLMPLHYKEQRRLNKMIKSSDEVGQAPSEATDGKKRLTPALDRLMQP